MDYCLYLPEDCISSSSNLYKHQVLAGIRNFKDTTKRTVITVTLKSYSASVWQAAFAHLLLSGPNTLNELCHNTIFCGCFKPLHSTNTKENYAERKNIHMIQRKLTFAHILLLSSGSMFHEVSTQCVIQYELHRTTGVQFLKSHIINTSTLNSRIKYHWEIPHRPAVFFFQLCMVSTPINQHSGGWA